MIRRKLSDDKNEWLMVEMRMCRAVLGISQSDMASLSGVAIQSIKRLEKKGTQPRYRTINKVREKFKEIGISCYFTDDGEIEFKLSNNLIEAINTGIVQDVVDGLTGKLKKDIETGKI